MQQMQSLSRYMRPTAKRECYTPSRQEILNRLQLLSGYRLINRDDLMIGVELLKIDRDAVDDAIYGIEHPGSGTLITLCGGPVMHGGKEILYFHSEIGIDFASIGDFVEELIDIPTRLVFVIKT